MWYKIVSKSTQDKWHISNKGLINWFYRENTLMITSKQYEYFLLENIIS